MRDDFIAGADAQRHQREPDGIGAVADADGVFVAVIRRQFRFKLFEHRAHDVCAAEQDLLDIGVDFLLDVLVLADVAVEFNFHGARS